MVYLLIGPGESGFDPD